jgi:hypothetical protein
MRGKKSAPPAHGSSVAAVEGAKSSVAFVNARVAASAPSAVTASAGGGQHRRWATPRTR